MKRKISFLLFFMLASFSLLPSPFLYSASLADKATGISAQVRAQKDRIRIGDELWLLLQVEHPRKYTVVPPSPKTDISPFEIKYIEPDPVKKGQNRVQQTFRLKITAFQTGTLEIPAITVEYRNEEGEPGQVKTEPVPVKVMSVGKKLTDKDDIRPIKGPLATGLLRFWSGLGVIVVAALFAALVVLIVRRKIRERREQESRKPPHERAKIELARLKEQGYLEEKAYQAYYSGLSDVLRRYLERRFGVDALDKTTPELVEELKQKNLEEEALNEIREVLSESDLVKFAKLVPTYDLGSRLEALLLEAVERTKPVDPERRAKRGVEG